MGKFILANSTMPVEVRPLFAKDQKYFAKATALIEECEGRGACSQIHIEKCALAEEAIVVGSFSGSELVGIATAQILPQDKSGSIVHISVTKTFRRQGLALRMLQTQLDFLCEKKCQLVVGLSWVNGSLETSNSVFLKAGFQRMKIFENYYRDSLKLQGDPCLICGYDCNCSAILFHKQFT